MDVVLCTLLVLISNGAGHIDIGADGKSDEQIGEQIDNGSRGTNGCQRRTSCKAADYNDIGGIKEKLKTAGQH